MRRIVTGHDSHGRPIVVSDGPPPRTTVMEHLPGMVDRLIWATESDTRANLSGVDPTAAVADFLPAPGETRFTLVTFPPDAVFMTADFDPAAARTEQLAVTPGLAETFEHDSPGMHRTPTIDYSLLLSGRIALDLGGGALTELEAGDVVIQNGTRHAWRNLSAEPATLAFILIGALPPDDAA